MHSKIYVCMMIYLIGPMGSGKTTIGKILSNRLKYQFFDTDEEIKKKTGMLISSIFDKQGESGFRFIESQMLEELSIKPKSVISTGGGIVLMKENRVIIKNGTCIYLKINLFIYLNYFNQFFFLFQIITFHLIYIIFNN